MPKNCCQKRLTATRAVSGCSGATSQLRQVEPRRPRVRLRCLQRRQDGRHAGLDLLARLVVLPAEHHERRRAACRQVAEDERAGDRRRRRSSRSRAPSPTPRGPLRARRRPAARRSPGRIAAASSTSFGASFLSGPPLTTALQLRGQLRRRLRRRAPSTTPRTTRSGSVAGSLRPIDARPRPSTPCRRTACSATPLTLSPGFRPKSAGGHAQLRPLARRRQRPIRVPARAVPSLRASDRFVAPPRACFRRRAELQHDRLRRIVAGRAAPRRSNVAVRAARRPAAARARSTSSCKHAFACRSTRRPDCALERRVGHPVGRVARSCCASSRRAGRRRRTARR